MAGENAVFRDMAISHQIGIRRMSTGVVNEIIKLLDMSDKDIVARIERLDPTAVSSAAQRKRLSRLLKDLRALNKDVYKGVGKELRGQLSNIAVYEASYTGDLIVSALSLTGGQLGLPTRQTLVALVTEDPFQGRLLSEWVEGLEVGRYNRLRDAIRMGVVEGESITDIVKRVRGTKALNYKDGVLDISRRSAEAMVRTAVNHTTTAARDVTMQENVDVLNGWRFVATLEPRTCPICAALDGKVFPIGEGPRPPRHPNCRCTTAPVVKGGGTADKITYNQWLKTQNAAMQDEALGPTRGELFRKGKLKLDRFADDNRVYTLNELKKRDPKAFKRIGM